MAGKNRSLKVSDHIHGAQRGVLFVCSANSARSQMAEGFARFLGPNDVEVFSAGTAPTKPNPMAIKAMKEVGVDISQHQAKGMRDIPLGRVALAITMSFEGE